MHTADRLRNYYNFDDEVLAAVADAAASQNTSLFAELADRYGIADGTERVVLPEAGKAIEVLTLTPPSDYDEHQARVYHQAYGAGIDANAAMHAIRLFGADPSQQLIVIGGATSAGNSTGKLPVAKSLAMVRGQTFDPLVRPSMQYLASRQITQANHFGYSAGADKAAAAVGLASEYGQAVVRGVVVEPVSLVHRGIARLARDFASTRTFQGGYIEQTKSMPYLEVWGGDSFKNFAKFSAGMLRLTNVATAAVLAHCGFADRLDTALRQQPESRIAVGWGTKSELVDNQLISDIVLDAQIVYGVHRAAMLRLQGMHHAGVDDIDLHAAMMLQGERL